MTEKVDILVIGAGVIGVAIARALALQGRDVLLLEAESSYGTGVSSRNSGVIHAGFYYPTDSLKAQLCVRGKDKLYNYCSDRAIDHKAIGKLVVSNSAEATAKLLSLKEQGDKNGVELHLLDKQQVKAREPHVRAEVALWSPSTGIIEVHDLTVNMMGDFENAGGTEVMNARVIGGEVGDEGIHITVEEDTPYELIAGTVINAAALGAQTVAKAIKGMPQNLIPPLYLGKGNYFALEGKSPFSHLIYPVPITGGLGAHSLVDFQGRVRFGPDVEWVDSLDYTVNPALKKKFVDLIRDYYPSLDESKLHRDFAGIRPKIVGPDVGTTDFMIQGQADHGIKGLINLFGMESPGLTSCMAIGDYVADMVDKN